MAARLPPSTKQRTNERTNQLTNQPTNQPTNQQVLPRIVPLTHPVQPSLFSLQRLGRSHRASPDHQGWRQGRRARVPAFSWSGVAIRRVVHSGGQEPGPQSLVGARAYSRGADALPHLQLPRVDERQRHRAPHYGDRVPARMRGMRPCHVMSYPVRHSFDLGLEVVRAPAHAEGGWLAGWLADRLVDWLFGWLAGCRVVCP